MEKIIEQNESKKIKREQNVTDSDFLPPLAPEVKSYGYQKDGQKHYKNIQITNYRTGKSILENYGEPFFEDDMTLIIPADKDNSPVPGTAISIILDRGAYLSEESVSVCLKEEYQWPYLRKLKNRQGCSEYRKRSRIHCYEMGCPWRYTRTYQFKSRESKISICNRKDDFLSKSFWMKSCSLGI